MPDLFIQVMRLAKECGLMKLGTVPVDGTKLKANPSRHKAMNYDRMKKAELELKAPIDAKKCPLRCDSRKIESGNHADRLSKTKMVI